MTYLLSIALLIILALMFIVIFKRDALIGWLGGYTLNTCHQWAENRSVNTNMSNLRSEQRRLAFLYKRSKEGRMVNIIHNELTNVTNQLLRMEQGK